MKKNICFFVCIILLFSLPCLAENKNNGRTVRVGVFPLEPINFLDKKGKARGLYPELIAKIAKQENWQVRYVQGSFATCLENLQSGRIDLITTLAYSAERARVMDFSSEPVVDIWGQIFTLPDGKIQSILDLKDRQVAIMKKDINGKNFITTAHNFGISCDIVEYNSHDDVFKAIQEKKAVAGVAPQHFGLRHAAGYNLVGTSIQFSPFSVFFATKKGHNRDLLHTIDVYLKEWKKDQSSVYYKTLSFWMGARYGQGMIPKWFWFSLVAAAALAILLFFFNRMLKYQVIIKTTELKESENQYRELVESANTVILRWDTTGNTIFINQFGLEIFGYGIEEVLGKKIIDILRPAKEFSLDDLLKMIERVETAPNKYTLFEAVHYNANKEIIHIQWSNKAITGSDGAIKEILSVGTDISQRKHLERHLVDAQKMEAIGTLAGGIAHDFNNILTVIMGNTEIACSNQNIPKDISANLDRVMSAAHRAKELTGQILAFSRESDLEKTPLNLAAITTEVLSMIRSTLPSTIQVNSRIDCRKMILANTTQIHQVILNLCTNAFHAMEDTGGVLTVSIQELSVKEDTLYPDGMNIKAGAYLILKISDTGPGISPEILPKIFEPYFTTKESGKGTGMGLAVAHGIIRDHKGYIRVYSTLDQGTSFNIYLPVAEGMNIDFDTDADILKEIKGGTERLMIVDDEKPIVDAFFKIFSNAGYDSTIFTESTAALKAFKEQPDHFDLIIADIIMPEMTGLQMSNEMMKIRPDIPVIICTGYNDQLSSKKVLSMGISEFLQKPVLKNDLLNSVRKALDPKADK